jgi:hypothetical protein
VVPEAAAPVIVVNEVLSTVWRNASRRLGLLFGEASVITGKRIREAGIRLGWGPRELAQRPGLNVRTIERAEHSNGESLITSSQTAAILTAVQQAREVLDPATREGLSTSRRFDPRPSEARPSSPARMCS